MAKICILNKHTRVCVNAFEDNGNWADHAEFIAAPRNDGDIGWILQEDGSWHNPYEVRLTTEQLWERFRQWRDKRLALTDVYVLPDFPITEEQRTAVMVYRQALRDLPNAISEADLENLKTLAWPEKPDFMV